MSAFTVDLRWRDLDHHGSLYQAAIVTMLDEARTQWFAKELGVESPDSYVVARIESEFCVEAFRAEGRLELHFGIERVGRSSIATRELVEAPDGRLIASTAITAVMWDRSQGSSRPLTHTERRNAARFLGLGEQLRQVSVDAKAFHASS